MRLETPDPVYVWSGGGTLIFDDADGNSRHWTGAGGIGAVDTVSEATDGSATGIRLTLFAAPAEFRENIVDQAQRGALIDYGVGALNETYQLIEGFWWLNRYRLDSYKITDNGTSITVEIAGESRAIDQRRPAIKRFTDEYQQRKHPGDRFFEYVPQMTEIQILWAKAEQSAVASPGAAIGGGGGSFRESSNVRDF